MSKEKDQALSAIERIVFKGSDPIVVALTGGWGEGKTYFWKQTIEDKYRTYKPAYVSVFGAESLASIRERVVMASLRLLDLEGESTAKKLTRKLGIPIFDALRRVANFWGGTIGVSDSILVDMLETLGLREGRVVCIDDVERLSSSIDFDAFLGFVTELRDKWKLKVVLIYNKGRIAQTEEGKAAFEVYEEKVIDRTIPFRLDFEDVLQYSIGDLRCAGIAVGDELRPKLELLGLKNIRIASKIRSYATELVNALGENPSEDFVRTALRTLPLIVYARFSNAKPKELTSDLLREHSEFTDRMKQKADNPSKEYVPSDPAKALLEAYGYMYANDLDLVLIQFVENDILDVHTLVELHNKFKSDADREVLASRLKAVWENLYHGTLADNAQEMCDALEGLLPPFVPRISPQELDSALHFLHENGRVEQAKKILDDFIRVCGTQYESLPDYDQPHGPFQYVALRDFLHHAAGVSRKDERTIAEVIESAVSENFVSSRDEDRLLHFTLDELVKFFVETPQPHLTGKIRILFRSNDPAMKQRARDVAERIAELSPLNRLRMEGVGLVGSQAPAEELDEGGE